LALAGGFGHVFLHELPICRKGSLSVSAWRSHLVFHGIQSLPSQVTTQEPQPDHPDEPQHHLPAVLGEYTLAAGKGEANMRMRDRR